MGGDVYDVLSLPDWTMSYAAAGHPAPTRTSATLAIPVGSLLVAFTDGRIERTGQDIDTGAQNARRVLLDAPSDSSLTDLRTRLHQCDEHASSDDRAILLARFG